MVSFPLIESLRPYCLKNVIEYLLTLTEDEMSRGKKWWERPVRMLRMDYAPDFSAIRNEDLEEVARNGNNA